ncbi:fatty acid-binding protein, liver-like [Branchiostoma lanceolatum]|uniref:fatty acid-binding protein, liver-like n=1 Tax=Branchiostoma lanceolatum TaxID=7740 RepID=UPI0034524AFB
MPFDLEKISGTYKITGQSDNFGEIMQKLGVQPDALKKLLASEITKEVTVSGNTFTDKTILGRECANTHTLGQESEETDAAGHKRKVTYTVEGDYLVYVYPDYDGNGLVVRQTLKWTDDKTILHGYKVGDQEGWTEAQKI